MKPRRELNAAGAASFGVRGNGQHLVLDAPQSFFGVIGHRRNCIIVQPQKHRPATLAFNHQRNANWGLAILDFYRSFWGNLDPGDLGRRFWLVPAMRGGAVRVAGLGARMKGWT